MPEGTKSVALSRRGSLVLPLLLALLLGGDAWTAFPGVFAQDREGGDSRGIYRRPLGQEPETLDPARIWDIYSRSVSQQIFDGLVQFDQTLAIRPALAEFWRASRDGLTWTFDLRKNVKFHHGRELTADDVVYSLTRLLDPRTRSGAAGLFLNVRGALDFREGRAKTVSGLVALDRHVVQVTLSQAHAPFVALVAVGHAKIVPRDLAEAQGEAFGLKPVGTGPFKLLGWERGKEIVLVANPDYFDGPPKLARLTYRIFPGDQRDVMHDQFLKGHLEDTPVPSRADRRALAASDSHIYVKRPMISVRFYGFNTRLRPLNDRRVRQAIVHAIDREAIIQTVHSGQYTLAHGVLPPGTLGFNPRLAGYAYDPARARELLGEAGYPGGRGLPMLGIWSSVTRADVVRELDHVKKSLATVGIAAEIHYHANWSSFSKMVEEGKLPVFLWAWYADVPDPDDFLTKLFHSRSSRNVFGYANPEVDGLVASAGSATDVQRRVELYRRAEQAILDDAPIVPVFHHTYERLFQPYVRSVEVNGLGDPYIPFRKIWLERAR
jgi:oligopeptide transport system substrate-binding protein